MADVFYEVDEQLRSVRLQTLFRRNWPYLAGLVALVLVAALGVWGWRTYEARAEGEASARYAQAMQVLAAGDTDKADAAFAAIAKDGTTAYRTLSLMQQAGIRLKAEDARGAAALFDRAAALAHDPITLDGAKLRAAFLLMDTAPYADIHARLEPLTAKGRPFRMLAREGLAIAELASGRAALAKGDFEVLSLSQDVSDATRVRANAALGMIQAGSAGSIGAIARAAIGLKPAPPPAQTTLSPAQIAAVQAAQAQQQAQGAAAGSSSSAPTPSGAPQ